jgi:hypothetical protein
MCDFILEKEGDMAQINFRGIKYCGSYRCTLIELNLT